MYMDLIEWLTGCGPSSPTMAVSYGKVRDPVVVQSSGLDVLDVPIQCWSPHPGELPILRLCWNSEVVGSYSGKGVLQQQDS